MFYLGSYQNNYDEIENFSFIFKVDIVDDLKDRVKVKIIDILYTSSDFNYWNTTNYTGFYGDQKIKNNDMMIFYSDEEGIYNKIQLAKRIRCNFIDTPYLYDHKDKLICLESLKIIQDNFIKNTKWLSEP